MRIRDADLRGLFSKMNPAVITIEKPDIQVVSRFPPDLYKDLWNWLNEFPERNFDDYGPKDFNAFVAEMTRRETSGERTWAVWRDGKPVGCVGYQPLTERLGSFHGICFTQSAWGRATTMAAARMVIGDLFGAGVEKIMASYFADNQKIDRFLRHLGARQEGYLTAQTMRGGEPVDMILVAFFNQRTDVCHLAA